MKKQIRNSFILALAAFIWGVAFVAQIEGGAMTGPFTFNAVRSLLGSAALVPVILVLDKLGLSSKKPVTQEQKRNTWLAGVSCGIVLFVAANLQQVGLSMGTGAGKGGFITACYILLVPIFGLFLKKRCGINVWIAVGLSVMGLYLLCMDGDFNFQISDLMIFGCAICFAGHILVVDHFSPLVDGVRLSCIQFLVCGVLGMLLTAFTEMHPFAGGLSEWIAPFGSWQLWIPLLYAGIMSSGVAYTLQIIGQNGLNPTIASLIMSLESVFAALAGVVLLNQFLSFKETMGCVIMFAAIVLAQLPGKKETKR